MGVMYITLPLRNDLFDDPQMAGQLREYHIAPIPDAEQGRWPTVSELHQALDSLSGYDVQFHVVRDHEWYGSSFVVSVRTLIDTDAPDIQPEYSDLLVMDFTGDKGTPFAFYFRGGSPQLHIRVLKQIAQCCGTYVFYLGDARVSVAVGADTDPVEAHQLWHAHLRKYLTETYGYYERLHDR